MKRTMMAACILSLVACGGSKDDVATEQQRDWESRVQSLVYSFPDQGQLEVPVPSPVVLRFSSPVVDTAPAVVLREEGGAVVSDVTLEWVDGKRGLIITPDSKLKPLTDYVVQVPAIELEKGQAKARTIRFTTRGLHEGPKSLVAADTFEVVRMIPDGENYPVMDFSSFRLQFSQPLDRSTVKYGDGPDSTIQLVGPEGVVDAHLLVSGPYVTVDPKEDLTPGAEYNLIIGTGLTSTYGETLPGGSFGNPADPRAVTLTVVPQDTTSPLGERVSMVQDVADTGELSPLTGKPINLVPMASVLLGEDTATQASGTIAAELAYVPHFPETTPFRVKRGSLIEGASIEVLIGGEVPAGFESGKVRMDFLSDATGYLIENAYSDADDAPRQVRLWMDVAVSTETPAANGAITQDLLHIELVGTSLVEDGRMVINAVGVVEPNVLGSERARGVLSFYMKAFEDQDGVEVLALNNMDFFIQSSNIDIDETTGFSLYNGSEPIVLNFNQPVQTDKLKDIVKIRLNGSEMPSEYWVDGSSIVINPVSPIQMLSHSTASVNIEVLVGAGLESITGAKLQSEHLIELKLPANPSFKTTTTPWAMGGDLTNTLINHSPIVLAVYPGYPCVLDSSTTNLLQRLSGRCAGGNPGVENGRPVKIPDDMVPVMEHPSNKPIIVVFSKDMDPDSIFLDRSFAVHNVDESGDIKKRVSGELSLSGKVLEFYPEKPWEVGELYSYTVSSSGYIHHLSMDGFSDHYKADPSFETSYCSSGVVVCDIGGLPLQTQVLPPGQIKRFSEPALPVNPVTGLPPEGIKDQWVDWVFARRGNDYNAGGPAMVQYFIGAEESKSVVQVLTQYPVSDRNANMVLDRDTTIVLEENVDSGVVLTGLEFYYDYNEPRPYTGSGIDCDEYDPQCLSVAPNFVKILSGEGLRPSRGGMPDLNVGCGYERPLLYDSPIRLICPENKFSAITASLIVEITDEVDQHGNIKVLIFPSMMLGSSINLVPVVSFLPYPGLSELIIGGMMAATGPQIMRSRFKEDIYGNRNRPIEAWIETGEGGAQISAKIDLYVDAPFVSLLGTGSNKSGANITSLPITLDVGGEVEFLKDGRMIVNQRNRNSVPIPLELYSGDGSFMTATNLFIPKDGMNLQFISRSIK